MNTGRWYWPAVAGLLAGPLASCAHRGTPAGQSQQAFEQAAKDQQELADAQKRVEAAHRDVAKAQQQLAQAQRREEQERARAQQLELRAREHLQQASQLAQQSQAAAEQAQGLQTATGQVAQATPSRLILQMQAGRMMSFHLDERTKVLVGTEQRSVADIQQGADARVSYDPKGPEPTAITIHVTQAGAQTSPPSPGEIPPAAPLR